MGYNERHCQLCGVSFNIGLLRTPEQALAEDPTGVDADYLQSFILNAIASLNNCDAKDGCMVRVVPGEGKAGNREKGGDGGDSDDNDSGYDVDQDTPDQDPYEFDSPNESDTEPVSDVEMTSDGGKSDASDDEPLWREEMNAKRQPKPFLRPLERWESDGGSHNDDGSDDNRSDNEADEVDANDIDSVDDNRREHIPGPNCTHTGGYHGDRISPAAMRGCTTVQVLLRKPDDWAPRADDEPFERDPAHGVCLSGLADHMPSTDENDPTCFPARQNEEYVRTDNCMWMEDTAAETGMPFHPTCLEVFRRASLRRSGKVDYRGLMDWFWLVGAYDKQLQRSKAVGRGYDQWWRHRKGDEHVVANPCYVPEWEDLVSRCTLSGDVGEAAVFKQPEGSPSRDGDPFAALPQNVRDQILMHLVSKPRNIANLRLASRNFRQLPQSLFRALVLKKQPWLWEAWCDMPYSFWTTKTAAALKREAEAWQERVESIEHSIDVLRNESRPAIKQDKGIPQQAHEDDNSAAIQALQLQLDEIEEEKREARQAVCVEMLREDRMDWHALYVGFRKPLKAWPMGLRNRYRIWKDCGAIMDEMKELTRQGKMGNGVVVDPVKTVLDYYERQKAGRGY